MTSTLGILGGIGAGITAGVNNYQTAMVNAVNASRAKQQWQQQQKVASLLGSLGNAFPATPGINPVASAPAFSNNQVAPAAGSSPTAYQPAPPIRPTLDTMDVQTGLARIAEISARANVLINQASASCSSAPSSGSSS